MYLHYNITEFLVTVIIMKCRIFYCQEGPVEYPEYLEGLPKQPKPGDTIIYNDRHQLVFMGYDMETQIWHEDCNAVV